jgi:hypothetical protein
MATPTTNMHVLLNPLDGRSHAGDTWFRQHHLFPREVPTRQAQAYASRLEVLIARLEYILQRAKNLQSHQRVIYLDLYDHDEFPVHRKIDQ